MPTKDRNWFERKVHALGDMLRRLPRLRQRALFDALDAGDELDARERTDRPHHSENSERGDGAKQGDT